MPPQTLGSRVEDLENRVIRLDELPGRLDDLTRRFRNSVPRHGTEFSAVRSEMRTGFAAVGSELGEVREQFGALATQLRVLHEDVIRRIALCRRD